MGKKLMFERQQFSAWERKNIGQYRIRYSILDLKCLEYMSICGKLSPVSFLLSIDGNEIYLVM